MSKHQLPCPKCGKTINDSDSVVFCPQCRRAYHWSCWTEIGKRCLKSKCTGHTNYSLAFLRGAVNSLHPQVSGIPRRLCPECGSNLWVFEQYCARCGSHVNAPLLHGPGKSIYQYQLLISRSVMAVAILVTFASLVFLARAGVNQWDTFRTQRSTEVALAAQSERATSTAAAVMSQQVTATAQVVAREHGTATASAAQVQRLTATAAALQDKEATDVAYRNESATNTVMAEQTIQAATTVEAQGNQSATSTAVALETSQARATADALRSSEATRTALAEVSRQATVSAEATIQVLATSTAVAQLSKWATATEEANRTQPATGRVASDNLRVRSGPGVEYQPLIATLSQGVVVTIVGWNTASDGTMWWKIANPSGWVHSEYVDESGCTDCVAKIARPPIPPTSTPAPPQAIATNRGALLNQGENGWTYQLEQGRNSGHFAAFDRRVPYNGIDCYRSPIEDYVRICENGNVHPGQAGRVAYRWDSTYDGAVTIQVRAHKVDTSCGDGIWVGTYVGQAGGAPSSLGDFSISAGNNTDTTRDYNIQLSRGSFVLVMVDIRSQAECDQSRLFIDIKRR